jgi:exodeoxyribonuclease-3
MPPKKPETFTVASLNLNGIRSAERKGFTSWLSETAPDHLLMQEVRATPDQVPDEVRSPAGYNCRWECAEKKGYAGTAIYTKSMPDSWTPGLGLEWADSEGRAIRADLPDLSLVSLYLPSGSSSEERQERKFAFMDHALSWLDGLIKEGKPMIVCGDWNIAHTEADIWNPKGNKKNSGFLPEEREWFSEVLALGWSDVFREQHPDEAGLYSWWSNRGQARAHDKGWRLDYVLATPELAGRAVSARIDKTAGLSDHAPVIVEFTV